MTQQGHLDDERADQRTVANMDLVGGLPVVDLVNTVSDRSSRAPHDRLKGYADLIQWCVREGLLETSAAESLQQAAASRPAAADQALAKAKELREALYEVFRAAAASQPPEPEALLRVNAAIAEAASHRQLVPVPGGFEWRWSADGALDSVLRPLAWSAGELLAGPDAPRLKECAQESCRWVFLDLSRNRSRRWCTMEDCGNRAKARRHYHRHREQQPS